MAGTAAAATSNNQTRSAAILPVDSIKALQIGDTIPEALWNLPLQMVKAGQEGSTTVGLNDYKGNAMIIDFWATTCGSCIAGMPAMEALQQKFGDELQILAVTYEDSARVVPTVQRNRHFQDVSFPIIVEDAMLVNYFPFRLLPHLVWIDRQGHVSQITAKSEVTENNVMAFLADNLGVLPQKIDIVQYDRDKPILLHGNTGDDANFAFRSIFGPAVEGLPSHIALHYYGKDSLSRAAATNSSILLLYNLAYKELNLIPPDRMEVQFTDSSKLQQTYCYELMFRTKHEDGFRDVVRQDLDRYLECTSEILYRDTPCLLLRALEHKEPKEIDLPEQTVHFKDVHPGKVINQLKKTIGNALPIHADQSLGKEMSLMWPEGERDWEEANALLKQQGYELYPQTRSLPYFILSDN